MLASRERIQKEVFKSFRKGVFLSSLLVVCCVCVCVCTYAVSFPVKQQKIRVPLNSSFSLSISFKRIDAAVE
jgi:hypothetical protein